MRSLLFVPGDSDKKLAKALESGADALILDLEDSVAPLQKAAAREIVGRLVEDPAPREWAPRRRYSTVTLLARLRGLSMSRPSLAATW